MRIFSVAVARDDFRDRNPTLIGLREQVTVGANGGGVNAVTYTVPTARRAVVYVVSAQVRWEAAAFSGSLVEARCNSFPNPGVGRWIGRVELFPGDQERRWAQVDVGPVELGSGEQVQVSAVPSASHPGYTVSGVISGIEYDA